MRKGSFQQHFSYINDYLANCYQVLNVHEGFVLNEMSV